MTELTTVVEYPARPLVVVLGGAKVSDKIGVIDRFLEVADQILIGGAMCFSFFKAQGMETGDSLVEDESVEAARAGAGQAEESDCELTLPVDLVLGREFAPTPSARSDGVEVPDGWMGLDIGPSTGDALRRGDRRRRHGALERADGRLRDGALRRPAPGPWPRRSPRRRQDGGRRRRLGRGDASSSGSGTRWTGSRPEEARPWSCSRGRSCPGSRR